MSPGSKAWRITWRLGICCLLLVWIFHSIFLTEGQIAWKREGGDWSGLTRAEHWRIGWTLGPAGLWKTLALVHPGALAASLLLVGITLLLGLLRWQMVLRVQGLDLPFARTAEISLIAHFFNSFLLGSTGGDLFKAYYAARETHHKKTEAVTTVVADRLLGLFAMLLFAGVMMLPHWSLILGQERIAAPSFLILAMLAACGAAVGLSFWGGLSGMLPRAREWLRSLPKGVQLERALESCRHFGRAPGFLGKSLALSMILNAVCVLQFLILARGLDMGVSASVLFFLVPVVICISALPITPSGLGVRENLFVVMLSVPGIDVPPTQALSLSLLAYAGSLFWSMVGGVIYVSLRERHHLHEITEDSNAAGTT